MGSHGIRWADEQGREIRVQVYEAGGATIAVRQDERWEPATITIPVEKREDIARCLAGWHSGVVPAKDLQVYKDVARENETLRAEVVKLREHRDELRQRISDNAHARLYTYDATCPKCDPKYAEAQAAQPDRPEPVDPWDVATGDVVDYERLPSFKTCRVVGEVQETFSDQDTSWSLRIHDKWWNCNIATVRILQRPEPVPDLEQIEALRRAWKQALAALGSTGAEPNGALLYELTRHGVHVEVPDAD